MARVINGMFPQPVPTAPANDSEPENSVTSDIGKHRLHGAAVTWWSENWDCDRMVASLILTVNWSRLKCI